MAEAKRMADRPRQLARLATHPQGLVRVAEVPQGQREITPVGNAGVVAGVGGPGFRALAVVVSGQGFLEARAGTRELAVEDFCTAPGRTVLASGELLVSIHLPPPAPDSGARYLRFIPRNEMDIAVAGAGVQVVMDNGNFRSVRIALAAVAPTPLFVREAGDALAGKAANAASLAEAADLASRAARPITDMRGSAEYRRHLCAVLTRRALEGAIEYAREGR